PHAAGIGVGPKRCESAGIAISAGGVDGGGGEGAAVNERSDGRDGGEGGTGVTHVKGSTGGTDIGSDSGERRKTGNGVIVEEAAECAQEGADGAEAANAGIALYALAQDPLHIVVTRHARTQNPLVSWRIILVVSRSPEPYDVPPHAQRLQIFGQLALNGPLVEFAGIDARCLEAIEISQRHSEQPSNGLRTRLGAMADHVSFSGAYRSAGILKVHATASRAVRIVGGTRSQ